MTIFHRLGQWKVEGKISPEQYSHLASLCREEPFSLFLELNVLLYAGVMAFVAGLGWTATTWAHQLGDALVLTAFSAILGSSFWYCFSRAPAWSPSETPSPTPIFAYVLYLGGLAWAAELTYLESRFHLLSKQWDLYLLTTAGLFFFLAYRFDNRLVLSLAMSSLAGWFGITISHWPYHQSATYRRCAILYSLLIGVVGALLQRRRLKPHFLGTYLNIAANVIFCALLSGVFKPEGYGVWFLGLLIACAGSLAWGLSRHQFIFVVYATIYGYIGVSSLVLGHIVTNETAVLSYFVSSAVAILVALIQIALRFGRQA
ncbi:MAG: DUF2157 domain-containing protein [Acidobacteriales bacterium]|nr:DUF2157 domain-containing protein [Terriglobales bacterium]